MPKATRAVFADEIENMVAAATEMHGALIHLIGNARSQGFQSTELDPLSLREAATEMMTAARECSDIAILLLAEAREIERRRQLERTLKGQQHEYSAALKEAERRAARKASERKGDKS